MIHVLLIEEDPEQKEEAYRCIYQYDKDALIDWVLNGTKAKDTLQCSRYDIVLIHFEAPGVCENEIWKYDDSSFIYLSCGISFHLGYLFLHG